MCVGKKAQETKYLMHECNIDDMMRQDAGTLRLFHLVLHAGQCRV